MALGRGPETERRKTGVKTEGVLLTSSLGCILLCEIALDDSGPRGQGEKG